MIPPISVETNTFRYTLDALLVRSDDLRRVAATVAHAAQYVGISARLNSEPDRLVLKIEIEHAAKDIAEVHADLEGVIATIEPSEWARASLVTGGPWPATRGVSEWVVNYAPWQSVAARWVPVTMTRRIDNANAP
ncbi:MAG: hypothetical protein F2525_01750, partial [Actinobacteria bacterium]|nr:hypothetical protein [Actinomycetota bacterium]